MSKLNQKKVASIKADLATGEYTQPELASYYGVSRSLISDIATNRAWKKVPWPNGRNAKASGGQHKKVPNHDPTDERIMQLEAEVAHLTEERNFHKRAAKAHMKKSGLFKAAVDVVAEKCVPFRPLPRATRVRKSGVIEEDLVLHLSDGHHDSIVTPEECGGLEEYNFPISCARAEKLVDTTLKWSQDTLNNFRFKNLWVLAYGDHTGGEIHGHEKRSYFRNQFRNTLAIGQLHALMYRDFAPHFENVCCVYVAGNHGRRTAKKDHHGAWENWDYLVAETAKLHCQNHDNIQFLIPNAFSINLDINGVGFNVSHGDDVRSNLGIPFYGMVRRQKALLALNSVMQVRVKYFCMGHHHTCSSLADLDGEMLVNGAWLATDAFSFNSFSGFREPIQLLHGVNPVHGVTWRMPVKLRHDAEKDGPQRYCVEL